MKCSTFLAVLWVVVGAEDSNDIDYLIRFDNFNYKLLELQAQQSISKSDDHDLNIAPLNVTFHLHTRQNRHKSELLVTGDFHRLQKSPFNRSNPTRIIVHGFWNCHESDFCVKTRQMFLKRQNYNMITVDWQSGKYLHDYPIARERIKPASEDLAKFIDFLCKQGGLNLQDLYLIGHSLGAHMSGLAGKKITSGKVNTIVGLDPAKPCFNMGEPTERLADTDAQYVVVIHTNGGKLGLFDPIGHTDFYPNGGITQPGCGLGWLGAACSHQRAWEFYAESIVSKVGFWSTLCNSLSDVSPTGCRSPKAKLKMGGEPIVQRSRGGILTVRTGKKAPYAEGKLK